MFPSDLKNKKSINEGWSYRDYFTRRGGTSSGEDDFRRNRARSNNGNNKMPNKIQSKIGAYIAGDVTADDLVHPTKRGRKLTAEQKRYSRLTMPPSSLHALNETIQKMTPGNKNNHIRHPLADYIAGKVGVEEMVHPSKLNRRKSPSHVSSIITEDLATLISSDKRRLEGGSRCRGIRTAPSSVGAAEKPGMSASGRNNEGENWVAIPNAGGKEIAIKMAKKGRKRGYVICAKGKTVEECKKLVRKYKKEIRQLKPGKGQLQIRCKEDDDGDENGTIEILRTVEGNDDEGGEDTILSSTPEDASGNITVEFFIPKIESGGRRGKSNGAVKNEGYRGNKIRSICYGENGDGETNGDVECTGNEIGDGMQLEKVKDDGGGYRRGSSEETNTAKVNASTPTGSDKEDVYMFCFVPNESDTDSANSSVKITAISPSPPGDKAQPIVEEALEEKVEYDRPPTSREGIDYVQAEQMKILMKVFGERNEGLEGKCLSTVDYEFLNDQVEYLSEQFTKKKEILNNITEEMTDIKRDALSLEEKYVFLMEKMDCFKMNNPKEPMEEFENLYHLGKSNQEQVSLLKNMLDNHLELGSKTNKKIRQETSSFNELIFDFCRNAVAKSKRRSISQSTSNS